MGYNNLQSNKKKAKRPIIINRYFRARIKYTIIDTQRDKALIPSFGEGIITDF
ncbi:hypothetical protein HMPREF6745_2244 [Prevotella sp. oral taxon 472 str. F0295]|nr:hypothetical protein HMPREF6745_2244 [Prevotella sp. oral taxon 472 str. F0295]